MPPLDHTPRIRPYRPTDRDAVADVCVRTAHLGGDSRAIHPDPRLMPSIFAEPYCHFDPGLAFVLDDGTGRAVGYILGTADTERFVADFRRSWIPRLAGRYPEPAGPPSTPTEEMIRLLHHPERMLVPELAGYPAHLHIDLLPGRHGRGGATPAAHLPRRPARTGRPGGPPRYGHRQHPGPRVLRPGRLPRDPGRGRRPAHLSGPGHEPGVSGVRAVAVRRA
ncbi:hypothetical protein ACE1SV_59450 [Streptomyces sp. E-15]